MLNNNVGDPFLADEVLAGNTSSSGYLTALVVKDEADPRNRTVWIKTILYKFLASFSHINENRATTTDLGTDTPSTSQKYAAHDQLPVLDKLPVDFSDATNPAVEADGVLSSTQSVFDVTIITTGINKVFKVTFNSLFIKWLKARTWLQSDLVTLVTSTITNVINNPTTGLGLIPVGVIWRYTALNDPSGFLICDARTISKASGSGTLKNDAYLNLFLHLYSNYTDTECPVSGGRSGVGSIAANNDWVANKSITLPDYKGKVSGGYKASDTNFGTLGKVIGTEIISAANLPVTSPYQLNDPGHSHGSNTAGGIFLAGSGSTGVSNTGNNPTSNSATGITVKTNNIAGGQSVDGGQKHFQPTIIDVAIIKY